MYNTLKSSSQRSHACAPDQWFTQNLLVCEDGRGGGDDGRGGGDDGRGGGGDDGRENGRYGCDKCDTIVVSAVQHMMKHAIGVIALLEQGKRFI